MGRRVALTALMTDPGVEAAGETVTAREGLDAAAGKPVQPGSAKPISPEALSPQSSSMQRNPVQSPVQQSVVAPQPLAQQPQPQQPSAQQPSAQQPSAQQPSAQQPSAQQPSAQQPSARQPGVRQPPTQQPRVQAPEPATPSVHQARARSTHADAAPPPVSIPASVVRAPGASPVRSVARARVSDRNGVDQAAAVRPTSGRTITDGPTVDLTSRTPALPQPSDDDPGEEELLFSDLERKEARLRWDQIEDLSRLAKRLNRARRGQPGRRITENTLIRVALDFLLENQHELAGRTEAELLDELRAAR